MDTEESEDRLEAALERIARTVAAKPIEQDQRGPATARLDRIIDNLRDALGK